MPSDLTTVNKINMPESQASNDPSSPSNSLQQQLQASFDELGYPQLQGIQCSVEDDTICLTGQLDSFYLKQVVQSVAVKIAGPLLVKNLIEVN